MRALIFVGIGRPKSIYEYLAPYMRSVFIYITAGIVLTACSSSPRTLTAPNPTAYERATIEGFERIRFYGDETPPDLDRMIDELAKLLRTYPAVGERIDMLALSGGADDGAYGAGFLKGWSERGDRPEFTWVTGVSTGALMAPFAFLGSDYDPVIRRFYTEININDIVTFQPLTALFGGSAVGDTAPLRAIIAEEVNSEILSRIAEEHAKGRTLFIGTTNLDAQRPVIWNIGRIASYGTPKAEALIEDILLASASIPGAFPPVTFDVVVDGERYQELHGDGGVTYNVFAYPSGISVPEIERRIGITPHKTLWVIRNTKLDADYKPIKGGLSSIASRAISTMIKYQGRGDVLRIQDLARRDGFVFYLTSVPQDFDVPSDGLFDPAYMGALYDRGYRDSQSEQPWRDGLGNIAPQAPVDHRTSVDGHS